MKRFLKLIPAVVLVGSLLSAFTVVDKTAVKCLIQLTNYSGEGAYSLLSSTIDTIK